MTTISIQLYSLRALDGMDAICAAAADAGFSHVELIESQLLDPQAPAIVAGSGLVPSSSHVSMAALRQDLPAVVAACRRHGVATLFMPSLPPEQRDGDAAFWRALGRELGGFTKTLETEGIALGYHNHHWDLAPKEGDATALDLLLAEGRPLGLGWEADLAWLVRAGGDPLAWLARPDLGLMAVHVKDLAAPGTGIEEDGWAVPGEGIMDWPALIAAARRAGADTFVAEHDKPADPKGFARAAHAALTALLAT